MLVRIGECWVSEIGPFTCEELYDEFDRINPRGVGYPYFRIILRMPVCFLDVEPKELIDINEVPIVTFHFNHSKWGFKPETFNDAWMLTVYEMILTQRYKPWRME